MGAFELWSGIMLKQLIGALSIRSWKVLIVAITRLGLCYYPKEKKKVLTATNLLEDYIAVFDDERLVSVGTK